MLLHCIIMCLLVICYVLKQQIHLILFSLRLCQLISTPFMIYSVPISNVTNILGISGLSKVATYNGFDSSKH